MSLRLLVSHKPSWIKIIILGFPLKSFPWCSWSQQQIDKNVIFILSLSQTIWSRYSKTSKSSSSCSGLIWCISSILLLLQHLLQLFSVSSHCWQPFWSSHWPLCQRADELCLILTKRWSFLFTELSLPWNFFYGWALLILLPSLFLNLLFHVNQSFRETLLALE